MADNVLKFNCKFRFNCFTATHDRSELGRSPGQMGHTLAIGNNRFLYAYGGLQGSLTSDIIAVSIAEVSYRQSTLEYIY